MRFTHHSRCGPIGIAGSRTTLKGVSVGAHMFIPVTVEYGVNLFYLPKKWNKDGKTGVADRERRKQGEMSI